MNRRTVRRYLDHPELTNAPRKTTPAPSLLDGYRDRIACYLEEDPDYRATWIFERLQRSGYAGGYEIVKRAVRALKQEKSKKAYVRFETEPGLQAQVDFGEFSVEQAGDTVRKYYLFSLILGYSRMLYAELLERCDLPSFLDAHQRAFRALGGTPIEVLYDRMRNVFLFPRKGTSDLQAEPAPWFTQGLIDLATHYGFTPKVTPAYAPWVKGKVERPFDFIREGFWRGYPFVDLPTANRDLHAWLAEKAQRVHGTTNERVDLRYEREKPSLQPLPPSACDVSERLVREVRKDCTIRVEGNSYVVEHTLVGERVLVRKKDRTLRIFQDDRLIVTYTVPDGQGHLVQDERFYRALREDHEMQARKFARSGRGHSPGRSKARAQAIPRTISPVRSRHPVEVRSEAVRPEGIPSGPPIEIGERYPIEVERRDLAVYDRMGGEVIQEERTYA